MDLPDPQASLDAAIAKHQAGHLAEAEVLYRAVLEQDPDDLDGLNLLGVLLQDRQELAESIALLTRACTLDPSFPEALANLARGQNALSDPTAAAASAREALKHDPDLAEAHLQLGRALLALEDNAGALVACQRAVALAPTLNDAQSQLGIALSRMRNFPAAADAFRMALLQAPDRVETQLALGRVLTELGQFPDAETAFRAAAALAPGDVRVHESLARMFYRAEQVTNAIGGLTRALELAPDRADLWGAQGENYAAIGRFDDAARCFRRSLALDPGAVDARQALASMRRLEASADEIDDLRRTLNDAERETPDRIAAGFALGAALDQAGACDAAFAAYDAANRLVRETAGTRHDPAEFSAQVSQLISAYGPDAFAATRGWGDPSDLPVYVVGMPRSGTTLVEQIAASHHRIHGAGERKDLLTIAQRLTAGGRGHRPAAWDRTAVSEAAREQIARLGDLGGTADRVVDKLPDNVLMLGLAAVLFPNARVVICRRDPRDVGLSCFFHRFGDDMPWTYDLASCGARAREVDRLIAHWLKALPLRIHEVNYETLVGDLESESRRLIEFLGLEWDPACLDFHRTERTVLSASRWQVRQPLYTTSVGRWRAYRRHLAPLIAALGPALPHDPASPSPPNAGALFRRGRELLDQGDAAAAAATLREAIALSPDAPEPHHHLGMALTRLSDPAGAAVALQHALDRCPDSVEIMSKLAWALTQLGQTEEALALHQRAVALAPLNPRVRLALVLFYFETHDMPGLAEAAGEGVALFPEDVELWLHLGHAQATLGHFADAAVSYRRMLELDPKREDARASLVRIGELADTLASVERRRVVLGDTGRPLAERAAAGYALGAALDKAESYDEAFQAFAEANRLAREELRSRGHIFSVDAFNHSINSRIAAYTPDVLLAMAGRGNPSELPVFVVGMPRSGTTLVEQIAASHPRVFGAGEHKDIGDLVTRMEAGTRFLPPTGWDQALARQETNAYLTKMARLGGTADRVVDKMPGNLLQVGAIATLLPNARIVICQRDPADACLSCFMQQFADGLPWATDLRDLAAVARAYKRLVAHWTAIISARLLVVQYETLVSDLEGQSRRLIDFLGLEWDPACLDFHRTERAVMTASLWQVRQPLYNTSVGRWRHYAKHLGPLLAGLSGLDIPAV